MIARPVSAPVAPLRLAAFAALTFPCLAAALFGETKSQAGADAPLAPLSFNRDIRPILSDHCFACHGPDANTREGGLRLDERDAAMEKFAIVPGDLGASELHWRVHSEDEDERMPPSETAKTLSDAEKTLLSRWIEEGASYEPHWAYLPPARPDIKEGGPAAIDRLVADRLAGEGRARSPRAPEHVLLRRLHFDLTGLPPAPDDLKTFREIGLEAYVDRLLASPHFGERMAVDWLDAARYADSYGYHGDQFVEVSAYRDWVIEAFNGNLPFDRFTIEQLAGDLLPDATLPQRVAATFNRLGQSSNEGGIQDAEYVAKYQGERVRTVSTAWLGSTLACAECHDHKYDPFTAADFYRFAAFFADILEKGAWTGDGSYQDDPKNYLGPGLVYEEGNTRAHRGPALEVPTEEQAAQLAALAERLADLRKDWKAALSGLDEATDAWAGRLLAERGGEEPYDYVHLRDRGEDRGVDSKGWTFASPPEVPAREGGDAVSRLQEAEGLVQHIAKTPEHSLEPEKGDRFFAYVWLDPDNPPAQVMLQFHHHEGGWQHRAWWGEDLIPYGRGSESGAHRRLGELPETGTWARLEVSLEDLELAPGERVDQFAFTQHGGRAYWGDSGLRTRSEALRWADLPEAVAATLSKPAEERDEAERAALREHYAALVPELAPLRGEIASVEGEERALRGRLRTVPATLSAKPREIRILPRGDWTDRSGPVVESGVPHFLPGGGDGENGEAVSGGRLELARWIVSAENPLTARTFANRLWARFFGKGISAALDDLGSQGEWPVHPELLDWLAVEFVESGWDVKGLVRTLVLSETYLQDSAGSGELHEFDPDNRLLARQSAIRLPAELVRDNALAVSGLLNPKIGGRSVRPYQPAGYYRHLNFPRREYEADLDDEQYRRGVYMHWQRSFLHPAMKAFDAPPREECTMERTISSTPLQALVLLNDPAFVEAAKALAGREAGLEGMFRRVLAREPGPEETALLEDLLASERARFEADSEAAAALLETGISPAPEGEPAESAARTSVARALLNLSETMTRR